MIVSTLARIIVREHLYKPIRGKVLTLGRQTIALTYSQLLELFRQEGYNPSEDILSNIVIKLDKDTRSGKGKEYITDDIFFKVLGIDNLSVMDISKYENCSIVHDLNKPIPESLYGQYDFIVDGGTFDHLFDIKTGFENVVKMLKPGGRILQWNAASNFTGAAYLSFGPDLFYDFYILNKFTDCKVYIAEIDYLSQPEKWNFYEYKGGKQNSHFRSSKIQITLVLAEKGLDSTWDKIPIQEYYRDGLCSESYDKARLLVQKSQRKSLSSCRLSVLPDSDFLRNWKDKAPQWLKKLYRVCRHLDEFKGYKFIGRI